MLTSSQSSFKGLSQALNELIFSIDSKKTTGYAKAQISMLLGISATTLRNYLIGESRSHQLELSLYLAEELAKEKGVPLVKILEEAAIAVDPD